MRRSTAAAVGTLTGAALILGVRLSVQPPAGPAEAAPAAQEVTEEPAPTETSAGAKKPAASSSSSKDKETDKPAGEDQGKFKNGTYKGKAVQNPYGTVQVTIKVSGGKISSANASYPKTGFSGTINPAAVTKLGQETLKAQSAEVDTVSGATFTSQSYVTSLQAAVDAAKV